MTSRLLLLTACYLIWLSATVSSSCVENPSPANCSNYHLPPSIVRGNINSLCMMMPNMPGCTVDQICEGSDYSSSQYCEDFSILKDICDKDMPNMGGCNNYTSLCNSNSSVLQCDTPMISLPTTMQTSNLILDICNEMNMAGCEECPGEGPMLDCDLLTVYSQLCISMPEMSQCQKWKTMCVEIPDWPLCSNDAPGSHMPPQMRMYFHLGIVDYILFSGWVPRTSGAYVGSWVAIFLAAILSEVIKMTRSIAEKRWKLLAEEFREEAECCEPPMKQTFFQFLMSQLRAPFRVPVDIPRAFLQCLEGGWSLLVMLVAMTFNVGLFLAILAGMFVGTLLVGRFTHYQAKASCH